MNRRGQLFADKQQRWQRATEIFNAANAENRTMTAEERARYDEHTAAMDEIDRQIAEIDAHEARERANASLRRDPRVTDDRDGEEARGVASAEYARAFERYLRAGDRGLNAEHRAALQAGDAATFTENRALSALVGSSGGYLVTPSFLNRIVETQRFYGGALQAGPTVINTDSGEDILWPTNDDTGNEGELLGENAEVSDLDVSFGQRKLAAYIYSSKLVKVPNMLLADTSFDLEGFLGRKFGQRLGRIANKHLTVGTGASQPQGMVTGAAVGKTTAGATAITYDELIDLEHSVDPAYRNERCGFMFADGTLAYLRKLKDSQGRPLWEPSLQAGVPNLFNGRRYTINNDMAAIATGNVTVLFGDFESYYVVRIVNGVFTVRLSELYARALQQGFFAVQRLDGGVQDAAAVKALKQA